MKKHLLWFVLSFGALGVASAQTITNGEYFFDTDPGVGSATSITVTPGTTLTNATFNAAVTSLSDGLHQLYLRLKDSNGNWGGTLNTPFYKYTATISPAPTSPNIISGEYFLDTDPGINAGVAVTVSTPATSLQDITFTATLTSISDGLHHLYLRLKDANGKWGTTLSTPFYKYTATVTNPGTTPNISAAEYYIDTDPGTGNGTAIPVSAGTTVNDVNFITSLGSLSIGDHTLYVRVKDANGLWGILQRSTFTVTIPDPVAQPTALQFSSVLTSSMTLSWTAASGPPAGYLVLRNSLSSPTEVPVDATAYSAGDIIGTSTVAYVGSAVTFNDASLSAGTTYYYDIFSYNGTTGTYNYLTTSPLEGSESTLITQPAAQPTAISFSSVTDVSMTVGFTAAAGSPAGYIGLRKTGSSSTDVPVDGAAYSAGNTIGTSTVAFSGSGTSFSVTGLTAATVYYYDIFSYNGSTGSYNYLTTTPLEGSQSTLVTQPAAQPTAIVFSGITQTGMTVSFSAATGSPSGYLALRKSGSSPTDVPVDGTAYTAGGTLGTSTIAYVGSSLSFNETTLVANTVYYYDIFSYNGSTGSYNYLTTTPLEGSQSTLITQPAAQPTAISFSSVTDVSMTVGFTAATGSPAGYIGLRKTGSSPTDVPVDGAAYSAGNTIGTSTVAFAGSGTSFPVTGLAASTTYYYDIFSYNGTTGTYNYLTTSPLEGSQTTLVTQPAAQPTAITFSNVTDVSMTVGFTAATGSPAGYIGLRKTGSSPTDVPVDGTAYSAGNTIGTSTVAFAGSGTSFSVTGLAASTTYYYDIFSYNGTTGTYNYLTTSPLEGSQATTTSQPTAQPTAITFSNVTDVSMTVGFTAATGSPAGYIGLRKAGSSPTDVPADGTTYSAGNTIGTSTVAFAGSGTSFSVTGLSAATVYYYDIFSYNGSTGSYNYLTTTPLEGSQTTLVTQPAAQPTALVFSGITQTGMTVSFSAATGSPSGYLALRKSGSSPTDVPVDGTAYTAGGTLGTSAIAYVGSSLSFNETTLVANTVYYYDIFSFNGTTGSYNYLTTTPLEGSQSTLITQPTAQPTAITFSNVTDVSMTVGFTAATGSPAGYIGLRKTGSSPTDAPSDGATYSAGNTIGTSTVAFSGSGTSFSVTGLTVATVYYYDIFSYNGSTGSYNYLTTTPLEGSQTTLVTQPAAQPTAITFSNVTDVSMTVGFTAATGSPAGYIGLRKTGSSPTDVPADGTTYSAGNIVGTSTVAFAGSGTSFSVTGHIAATVYYYDIFSYNGSTGSYNYLTTTPLEGSQSTLVTQPAAQPTAITFSNVTNVSMTVGFTAATGSPAGYIGLRKTGSSPTDVPADGTTYSAGNTIGTSTVAFAGSGTSFSVTGLTAATVYYYDIFSYNGSTGSYNYLTTTPLEGNATTIGSAVTFSESFPATYDKGSSLTVSITVSDASKVSKVNFKSHGISESSTDWATVQVTATGNKFEKVIPANELTDRIGLKYYFEVTDNSLAVTESSKGKSLIKYPTSSSESNIPDLRFGDKVSDYQIVSVPLQLTSNTVSTVFSTLMPYDRKLWRLYDYASGDNREYPGFSTIEPGKGYWLIVRNTTTLNPGEGKTVDADETNPFTISLAPGYNLIGNPYNFRISWADVKAASGNPVGIDKLLLFGGSTLSEGDLLDRFRGGFVLNGSTSTVQLKFPVLRNTTLGGGRTSDHATNLDSAAWELELSLTDGELTNKLGGIGINPKATLTGKDEFDIVSVPVPFDLFELSFPHPELETSFNREVVPSQDEFTWEFEVLNAAEKPLQLSWPDNFSESDQELFMIDPAHLLSIDMKKGSTYQLSVNSRKLKIVYGSHSYVQKKLDEVLPVFGTPFPNPASEKMNFTLRITEEMKNELVTVKVFNSVGQEACTIINKRFDRGTHVLEWVPDQPGGVYLLKMALGSKMTKVFKVIIN